MKQSAKDAIRQYKQERRSEYLEKHRIRERERAMWHRAWLIAILGGKYELCGCKNPLMLSLDHKLKDGKAHRKQIGRDPNRMYTAVLREGCPPKRYRLLCMSCNLAVSNYGEKAVIASINEERRSTHE